MFSTVKISRAALVSYRPVLASSVSTRILVKRLLGGRGAHVFNIDAINSVITKTNGQGLPGIAGILGRAAFYAHCMSPEAALADIEKVFLDIKDDDLKYFALAVRLWARAKLLDVKEAGLKVDGGATEMDVSDLRGAFSDDIEALKSCSNGCWLVEMARAECFLYEGKAEVAYKSFCDVEKKINDFIASLQSTSVSFEVASAENTPLASLLVFLFGRTCTADGVELFVSNLVKEGAKNILKDDSFVEFFTAFKKELGFSFTDEEAIELAYVFDAAHARNFFHDYFLPEVEYGDWNSERAKKVNDDIVQACRQRSTVFSDDIFENVKKSVPAQAFYAPDDQLRKFLSSSTVRKNYISELRETFGPGPESVLAKTDEAYFEALRVLEQAPLSADVAGTVAYPMKQKEVCAQLACQLLYRTRVNAAVALTQMDRSSEAVEILDGVIAANEFIYMWRAYFARGEAYKRLGLVSKSDKDFRQLTCLKKNSVMLS